jgi:large subunit ribosomal protein L25
MKTMSKAVKQIKATSRMQGGKGAARALRRTGQIPAVIYGGGAAPAPIALDYNVASKLIFAGHFLTTIFEIDVDGTTTRAIPRDYQMDPVKDFPMHIDFLRLTAGQKIKLDVPVHVINHAASPGIKRGGTVNLVLHSIEMMVPGDAIPDGVTVDLTGIDIGKSIHISMIALPENCTPVDRSDFTIATVVASAGMKEAPAAEAPAAAAAAAPAAKK